MGLLYVNERGRLATHRATYTKTDSDVARACEHTRNTSRGTLLGNAAQHLAPHMPDMADRFLPNEWRFVGSPIDFIVFEGCSTGDITGIVLVEVKSGNHRLNHAQSTIAAKTAAGLLPLTYELVSVPPRSSRAKKTRP